VEPAVEFSGGFGSLDYWPGTGLSSSVDTGVVEGRLEREDAGEVEGDV
jgi:hypothetical protein